MGHPKPPAFALTNLFGRFSLLFWGLGRLSGWFEAQRWLLSSFTAESLDQKPHLSTQTTWAGGVPADVT